MNQDLTKKLYNEIDKADKPRVIEHWHCNSIAKCSRALMFERLGVTPLNIPGAGKKFRWRSGHAIEATIRPELKKIYPEMVSNIRFTNERLDLTGEFDGYDPESKTLISVKSVHDFAFATLDGLTGLKEKRGTKMGRSGREVVDWGLKRTPYIHHAWQEHAYVYLMSQEDSFLEALGTTADFDIKDFEVGEIAYVYITLGGLIATYSTPVSISTLQAVVDKVDVLSGHWEAHTLPSCECQEGKPMWSETNQYCSYKDEYGCCSESLVNNFVKEKK